MHRYEQIRFCPQCGERYANDALTVSEMAFRCRRCTFVFYQNSLPSATAVIPSAVHPEQIVMLTRATAPQIGKLAFPGGLLTYGEEPVDAARREVLEETGLEVDIDRLLCAFYLDYLYLETHVAICELSFLSHPVDVDLRDIETAEASKVAFYDVAELCANHALIAFPEQLQAIQYYRQHILRT